MKVPDSKSIIFFKSPEAFRKWLEKYASNENELYVGYYKKATGLASITWPQSVDEALCYGWIDGIRRSLGATSYCIRFTPRRTDSHWSAVNVGRMKVLQVEGRIKEQGLVAFNKRKSERTAKAAYEQEHTNLHTEYEARIRANIKAWTYFNKKPPSYRKQCIWWIMSAKKETTQLRRLDQLIRSSSEQKVIPPLKWTEKDK